MPFSQNEQVLGHDVHLHYFQEISSCATYHSRLADDPVQVVLEEQRPSISLRESAATDEQHGLRVEPKGVRLRIARCTEEQASVRREVQDMFMYHDHYDSALHLTVRICLRELC